MVVMMVDGGGGDGGGDGGGIDGDGGCWRILGASRDGDPD